ncbi:MAG TPA: hypothetical protein VGA61_17745 [Anaerolineae bacterium]
MDEDTTDGEAIPALLAALLALLAAHRPAFRQERPYRRAVALVFGEVFAFARHTVTQCLLTLGLAEADWSAWYRLFSRPRYTESMVARLLLQQTLPYSPTDGPYVTGIDTTQAPRTSYKLPGSSWLRAPRTPVFMKGIHRAQRFLHGAWLPPIQGGYTRAIPLRFLPAFPAKARPADVPPCKEWEAGLGFVQWVRQELDAVGRAAQRLLVLADGAYDTVGLWLGLPARTILVVRTAKNRRLRELPVAASGRGRRRKYGPQAPRPQEWLKERKGFQKTNVDVRGRTIQMRYRVLGPYVRERAAEVPLFLFVVGGATWKAGKKEPRRAKREPAFYLVNAVQRAGRWVLPLSAPLILAWIWQRWELEVAHREMKSGLGVGQKQCWNRRSAVVSVQWSVWVYAILVLAGYQAWGLFGGPRRPERWWPGARRWSFNTLWRGYRAALWGTRDFRAIWTPIGDDWLKKEAWIAALSNAAAAAARA